MIFTHKVDQCTLPIGLENVDELMFRRVRQIIFGGVLENSLHLPALNQLRKPNIAIDAVPNRLRKPINTTSVRIPVEAIAAGWDAEIK